MRVNTIDQLKLVSDDPVTYTIPGYRCGRCGCIWLHLHGEYANMLKGLSPCCVKCGEDGRDFVEVGK